MGHQTHKNSVARQPVRMDILADILVEMLADM